MKSENILDGVVRTLGSVKVGGARSAPDLAELDRGILTVALMVAGLDGSILPAEHAAFEALSKLFRSASDCAAQAVLDQAVEKAGTLMAMSQVGAYSEKDRLTAFVRMAVAVLPKRYSVGTLADLRRAFTLWVAMAVSDGTFSELEHAALASLARRLATVRIKRENVKRSLLEPDFFDKAEKLVRGLSLEPGKASERLAKLVGTVEHQMPDGRCLVQPAAKIALPLFVACLAAG